MTGDQNVRAETLVDILGESVSGSFCHCVPHGHVRLVEPEPPLAAQDVAEALRAHVTRRESDYDGHIALADLLESVGDARGAADVLERAMYIHPYDAAVHERMAGLYAATRQHEKVVRERRAILALNPVNRADAHYHLAAALLDAGDRTAARREVLRALEIAPNFADAQQLLLRLQDG